MQEYAGEKKPDLKPKIKSKWVDNLPVSTKWLQNTKILVFTLLNIQALLISGIMGEETGSRSKFDSIPSYELCLKITTYSIYEVSLLRMRVGCPNFKLL